MTVGDTVRSADSEPSALEGVEALEHRDPQGRGDGDQRHRLQIQLHLPPPSAVPQASVLREPPFGEAAWDLIASFSCAAPTRAARFASTGDEPITEARSAASARPGRERALLDAYDAKSETFRRGWGTERGDEPVAF